jgi:hypothetical protein
MSGIPRHSRLTQDEPAQEPLGARSIREEKQVEGAGVVTHATQHKTGGGDALPPADIGAALTGHTHTPLDNLDGAGAPAVTDDETQGYEAGSVWIDVVADKAYVCVDASAGAAVWTETTAGAAGGEANTGSDLGGDAGTFKQKAGVNLEFRGITGGTGVTVTENATDIDVDADVASTAQQGIAELAEVSEANAGTSGTLVCTPDSIGSPLRTVLLTAAGGAPATTTPCSDPTKVEAGTNDVDYWVLDFDTAADEYAFWGPFPSPGNWDAGTWTAMFYWTAASGSGTVQWAIQMKALDNDDAIDTAWGTAVLPAADTLITAGDVHKTAVTAAITPATPVSRAAEDLIFIRVYRDVSGDTLGVDARLIAVKLEYTCEGYSD